MLDRLQNKSFEEVCKNLSTVCENWHTTIRGNVKRWVCKHFNIEEENKDVFWCFFKGKLIYKPNPNIDVVQIDLFISALPNPLEGTFNLSNCGNTDQYLSISTGYRQGRRPGNANKVEIWFALRFLIEKEIYGTASHFKDIFLRGWKTSAPVGIIWTCGDWEDLPNNVDYLTTENMDNLSKIDLYENWKKARVQGRLGVEMRRVGTFGHGEFFHVSFVN